MIASSRYPWKTPDNPLSTPALHHQDNAGEYGTRGRRLRNRGGRQRRNSQFDRDTSPRRQMNGTLRNDASGRRSAIYTATSLTVCKAPRVSSDRGATDHWRAFTKDHHPAKPLWRCIRASSPVDSDGTATIEFAMPDFNGTVRVDGDGLDSICRWQNGQGRNCS